MGSTCSKKAGRPEQYRAEQEAHDPPLLPPRLRKRKLIPDPEVTFKEIDFRARNAPAHTTGSVASLARYLERNCTNDTQKARAAFVWLTHHVTYDVKALTSHRPPQGAGDVLRTRLAVCQGYSELFKALCDCMEVTCRVVSGLDKGFGYDPGCTFTTDSEATHAWNVVHVQQEWRPVDCTWGAGRLGDNRQFERRFEDFWFLTDPDHFLLRHFPHMNGDPALSLAYQLVKKPIDVAKFSALAYPSAYAHKQGVRLLSHPLITIDVKKLVTVKLRADDFPLTSATAHVTDLSDRVKREDRSCVVTSLQSDGTCSVLLRPPRAGRFLLRIYGTVSKGDGGVLPELVTYLITCSEGQPITDPYPDNGGHYGYQLASAPECGLKMLRSTHFPFEAKKGEVRVPVPLSRFTTLTSKLTHATKVKEVLTDLTFIQRTQEGAEVLARLPQAGYYLLRLFAARHEEDQTLQQVADFLLHATNSTETLPPFPKTYKFEHKFRAHLIHPLAGRVARDRPSLYRVHAPDLVKVKVGDMQLEQRKGGVWEGQVTPGKGLSCLTMCGSPSSEPNLLYRMFDFTIVTDLKATRSPGGQVGT